MKLTSILLAVISKMDKERTVFAGLHILRGKRSGQSLQDAHQYGLQHFFGILPKLQTERFAEAAEELEVEGFIRTLDDGLVQMTALGKSAAASLPSHHFNGIDYQGREMVFFERLSLLVQTLSYVRSKERSFLPVQRNQEVQRFVKQLLLNQPRHQKHASSQLAEELRQVIRKSGLNEEQKLIFTHRLTGKDMPGKTWDQLSISLSADSFSVYLLFIEALHKILQFIETEQSFVWLKKAAEQIKIMNYLTDSSIKTKQLFEQGLDIEQISNVRRLKMSTIEDHFVEMAIHDSHFPLHQFVTKEDMTNVAEQIVKLGTKRLRPLKEVCKTLSYFQLRLILSTQGGGSV